MELKLDFQTTTNRRQAAIRALKNFERKRDLWIAESKRQQDQFHSDMDAIEETLPPLDKKGDGLFAPPSVPVSVKCQHCGSRYSSNKIVYERRLRYRTGEIQVRGSSDLSNIAGMYWCKYYDCDGAGYGFDILPVADKRVRQVKP